MTILFVGQRNSPLPYMVYAPVNTVKQLDEIEAGAFRNHWMVGERSKYIEIDGAYFYRTSNFLSTTELEGGFSWRRLGTLIQGDPWPVSNLVDRTTLKSIEFVTKPWLDATKKDPFLRGKDGATAEIIRQCDIVSLKTVTLQVKQLQSKLLDGRKL